MRPARILATGASGSGTTTIGRLLANHLDYTHHDTDDYYWKPTPTPYQEKRARNERVRLMKEVFVGRRDWILSGSVMEWGDFLMPHFEHVVFLYVPAEVRQARLWEREGQHFGSDAIAPDGWRHQETSEFVEWAGHYDDGSREGRNLADHETWLAKLKCPVLRLDGTKPTLELVEAISEDLRHSEPVRAPWSPTPE